MNFHRTFLQGGSVSIVFLLPFGGSYVAEAVGDTQDFERGLKLADEARQENDWERRDQLLAEANGTWDLDERREIFCELEQMQMDRGSIGVAYWLNTWLAGGTASQNWCSFIRPTPMRILFKGFGLKAREAV